MDNFRRRIRGISHTLTAQYSSHDASAGTNSIDIKYDGQYVEGLYILFEQPSASWFTISNDSNSGLYVTYLPNYGGERAYSLTITYEGLTKIIDIRQEAETWDSGIYACIQNNNFKLANMTKTSNNVRAYSLDYYEIPTERFSTNNNAGTIKFAMIKTSNVGRCKLSHIYDMATASSTSDIRTVCIDFDGKLCISKDLSTLYTYNSITTGYTMTVTDKPEINIGVMGLIAYALIAPNTNNYSNTVPYRYEKEVEPISKPLQNITTITYDIPMYVFTSLENVSVGTIFNSIYDLGTPREDIIGKLTMTVTKSDPMDLPSNYSAKESSNTSLTYSISPS